MTICERTSLLLRKANYQNQSMTMDMTIYNKTTLSNNYFLEIKLNLIVWKRNNFFPCSYSKIKFEGCPWWQSELGLLFPWPLPWACTCPTAGLESGLNAYRCPQGQGRVPAWAQDHPKENMMILWHAYTTLVQWDERDMFTMNTLPAKVNINHENSNPLFWNWYP